MRFFGYSNRHLDARIAPSKDSGRYAIAEIAIRDIVDDEEFVTSAGVAFRRDEMSDAVRARRDEINEAAEKQAE